MPFQLRPGEIIQAAYIVENLEDSIQHFARELNLGGWVVMSNMKFSELTYRGHPTALHISAALAYSGEMMYELIQQHDAAPSVFSEVVAANGYGFHHIAIAVRSLEDSIHEYESRGYPVAMRISTGVARGAYMDTRSTIFGMLELLEIGDAITEVCRMAYVRAQKLPLGGPLVFRI